MKFVIPGKPIPLARARVSKNFFYDPQYQVKKNVLEYLKVDDFIPYLQPLEVDFLFEFETPKSWSKKKRALKLNTAHDQTPDLDNNVKFILDLLNKKIWIDDKIIYKISAKKIWSDISRTTIEVNEKEKEI